MRGIGKGDGMEGKGRERGVNHLERESASKCACMKAFGGIETHSA